MWLLHTRDLRTILTSQGFSEQLERICDSQELVTDLLMALNCAYVQHVVIGVVVHAGLHSAVYTKDSRLTANSEYDFWHSFFVIGCD